MYRFYSIFLLFLRLDFILVQVVFDIISIYYDQYIIFIKYYNFIYGDYLIILSFCFFICNVSKIIELSL